MRKRIIVVCGVLSLGIIVSGCWATMGSVQTELTKTKKEITDEQNRSVDDKIGQVTKRMETLEKKLDTDYATKLNNLQSMIYDLKQSLEKSLETLRTDHNKRLEEIEAGMANIQFANKDEIADIAKKLTIAAKAFQRQLQAQKEGIEQAISELEQLSLTTPGGGPEKPPEK